jgi:hypothetical protein
MYVRYLGTKVCWTVLATGAFYIGSCDELTDEERALCDNGGGEMPLSFAVAAVAR